MDNVQNSEFDILIVGAGPAGCTAALALKDSGLKVAMLERESFPRDKVCGDAIPARALHTLDKISPELSAAFTLFDKKLLTKHTDVVYNTKSLKLHWQIPAYTCTRLYFDNHLIELVKHHTDTSIFENVHLQNISVKEHGYELTDKNGNRYTTKLLIGADGAQSVVAKQLTNTALDRAHHIGAVRAYYKNITALSVDKTEMYINKRFLPGYFWIFPVADGLANVGFGMISEDISAKKVNMKTSLTDFIDKVPVLKERFANAELIGKIEGHNLPLGSRRVQISGDRFMLCGDAASLIDPITGEGIGNAMLSGRLAAVQAMKCFETDNFGEAHMKQYDEAVWAALGKELGLRTRAQRLLRSMPVLLKFLFAFSGWEPVRKMIQNKF